MVTVTTLHFTVGRCAGHSPHVRVLPANATPVAVHVGDAPAAKLVTGQVTAPILSSVSARFVNVTLPMFVVW